MDTKNMIKTVVIFLLCFSVVALAGVNIYQYVQIRRVTQAGLSEAPPTSDSMPGTAKAALEPNNQNQTISIGNTRTGDSEADELMYQLAAAEEELSMVNEQLASDEANKASRKKIQQELRKRYQQDPSYKESMRNSLDIKYPDLFKKLNLSPENLAIFKDLLIEEELAQEDIFLEYSGDIYLTDEQREERNQRLQAVTEEYETKKKVSLGENGYAAYQGYRETWSERYKVNNFIESLGSDEKLSEPQKESLIEAMNKEGQYVVYDRAENESESSTISFNEENIARDLSNYNRTHDAYLKAANSILSASQYEKFEAYLADETEEYKLFLEMMVLRQSISTSQ